MLPLAVPNISHGDGTSPPVCMQFEPDLPLSWWASGYFSWRNPGRDSHCLWDSGKLTEATSVLWRWHCKPLLSLLLGVTPNKAPWDMQTWALTWSYLPDSEVTPNCVFATGNRVPHHNVCHSVDLHPCQPGSRGYSVFLHWPSEPRTPSRWVFFPVLLNQLKNSLNFNWIRNWHSCV